MTDINTITLVGRLTRDVELKYATTGTPVATMSIAVNKSVKKNEQWTDEVSFFDITLWGRRAEGLSKYLIKGQQIAVSGSLKQDRWTDKDGQNHSRVKIDADNIQLLGGKKE